MARLGAGDLTTAVAHLQSVETMAPRLGFDNLPALSDDLLLRAAAALDGGDVAMANTLLDHAERLAPDSVRPRFFRLTHRSELGRSVSDWLSDVWTSVLRRRDTLLSAALFDAHLAAAALLALVWFAVLWGAILFFRHGARFFHDVAHLLPSSMRGPPFVVVGLTGLVLLPLSVGVGLMWMALGWAALLGRYFGMTERVVTLAVLIGLLVVPELAQQVEGNLAVYGSLEQDLYRCSRGRCASGVAARIRAHPAASPADQSVPTLAEYRRAAALTDEQPELLQAAVTRLNVQSEAAPNDYLTSVGSAVAQYTDQWAACRRSGGMRRPQVDAIDEALGRAAKLSTRPTEAEYNRSVLFFLRGLTDEGLAARERAQASERARVAVQVERAGDTVREDCAAGFAPNLQFMMPRPSVDQLQSRLLARAEPPTHPPIAFRAVLTGLVTLADFPLWCIGAGVLMLVMTIVPLRPAHHCTQCHTVACGRCRRELYHVSLCERCLYLRIQGAFVDSRDKWLRDRRLENELANRAQARARLGFLIPGGPQVLDGKTVMGVILLAVAAIGAGLLLGGGLLPDGAEAMQFAPELAGGFLFVSAYLVSLADTGGG